MTRKCSRPSCYLPAVSTLTYVYADSTVVVGPLSTYAEPHCYDLCEQHSARAIPPVGWELVRLDPDPAALLPSRQDLTALADAVRRAAAGAVTPASASSLGNRRGHLHVVPTSE